MMEKNIIVLAESAKHKNYCVGGIDLDNGEWVRIVSEDEDTAGALTSDDLTYADGSRCLILDKVSFPVLEAVPTEIQPENYLIDRSSYIKKLGEATLSEVLAKHPAEKHNYLFGTKFPWIDHDFFLKQYDKYSLALIEATNLEFERKDNNTTGVSKLKVSFDYLNGLRYKDMAVTDPNFYLNIVTGAKCDQTYMLLSIGAALDNGKHYLFVAKIFRDPHDLN